MSDELTISFLGALQASLSVLLVIFYGVLAAQFKFLEDSTTKQISSLCIRMFLPALLATNVGSQLHAETGMHYVPILSEFLRPCTCLPCSEDSMGNILYNDVVALRSHNDSCF